MRYHTEKRSQQAKKKKKKMGSKEWKVVPMD